MGSRLLKDKCESAADELVQRVFRLLREPRSEPPALGVLIFAEEGPDKLATYSSGERAYIAPLITLMPQLLATLFVERCNNHHYGPVLLSHAPEEDLRRLDSPQCADMRDRLRQAGLIIEELGTFALIAVQQVVAGWPRLGWPLFWAAAPNTAVRAQWANLVHWEKLLQANLNAALIDLPDWNRKQCPSLLDAVRYRLSSTGILEKLEGKDN